MDQLYQCPECEYIVTETMIRQFRVPPEQAWCPRCAGVHLSAFVRRLTSLPADRLQSPRRSNLDDMAAAEHIR